MNSDLYFKGELLNSDNMKMQEVIEEVECFCEMDNDDEQQEFTVSDNGDCITISVIV